MFIFFSTLIFCIWLAYELKKHTRLNKKIYDRFWEKEREANLVRKQPLDTLSYVSVPLEFIPKSLLAEDPDVAECLRTLENLAEKKIVNLTCISNTDLKMKYGAANLNLLSEYDENYTIFIRTMDKLAHAYYKNGYESNALIISEKSIETGSDIKATYTLLADIYKSRNETEKISDLLLMADRLHSGSKNAIKRALTGYT